MQRQRGRKPGGVPRRRMAHVITMKFTDFF